MTLERQHRPIHKKNLDFLYSFEKAPKITHMMGTNDNDGEETEELKTSQGLLNI